MIINGKTLLEMAPIRDMLPAKRTVNGVSHGLTECGYDIRLKQDIIYRPCASNIGPGTIVIDGHELIRDNFVLGSSLEYFELPDILMGRVLNKSTWAREGVDASLTTNIEPGFRGNLTIELVFNRNKEVHIPAGVGICQVIFERILNAAKYTGKYQDQEDRPVEARFNPAKDNCSNPVACSRNTYGICSC